MALMTPTCCLPGPPLGVDTKSPSIFMLRPAGPAVDLIAPLDEKNGPLPVRLTLGVDSPP